jgi:hypothetical protein
MGTPPGSPEAAQDETNTSNAPSEPPAKPNPADDPGVVPSIGSPLPEEGTTPDELDIFVLSPVAALKMLCRYIDTLVRFTGDIPPTPPVRSRGHSPQRLTLSTPTPSQQQSKNSLSIPSSQPEHIDGVPFVKTPIGSPEAHLTEPHIIGDHAQPVTIQHGHIARKFFSKRPPPISTTEYLMRMHKYCPMSTAVYLATSCYITRMAVVEKIVPVTPRNVHRLLLAGLRVAMKALEDLSWPHARFSKVGGVSEVELGRLEITFCFLMDFELKVDAEMLTREVLSLSTQATGKNRLLDSPVSLGETLAAEETSFGELRMPEGIGAKGKRKASSALPERPKMEVEAPG